MFCNSNRRFSTCLTCITYAAFFLWLLILCLGININNLKFITFWSCDILLLILIAFCEILEYACCVPYLLLLQYIDFYIDNFFIKNNFWAYMLEIMLIRINKEPRITKFRFYPFELLTSVILSQSTRCCKTHIHRAPFFYLNEYSFTLSFL